MYLPKPLYNVVPCIYFAMGIATLYFVIEAVMLEKGMSIATFLYISALALIAHGIRIKHLRHTIETYINT